MEIRTSSLTRLHYSLVLLTGLLFLSGFALADDGDLRVSTTTQSLKSQRGMGDIVSRDEFDALVKTGPRSTSKDRSSLSKSGAAESSAPNLDFWFYTADTELFNDHDNDGYYHGIDLLFDADTIYAAADVYAVVYLSLDGGPWNEYAATENFTLLGATGDDEYVIVTELLSGYPGGSYDILIELFDAADDSLLAWYGPDDTSELAFLPLEDASRDEPFAPLPDVVVVHEHGGGSASWPFLLSLLGAIMARRARPTTGSQ